jgi:hypothetical protein
LGGGLLGFIIAWLVFPGFSAFWIPGIFFLIGAMVSIQTVFMKKSELKNWVGVRLSHASMQRQATLIAIGLVVWSAITILPQEQQFLHSFEEKLLKTTISSGNGNQSTLSDAITNQLAVLLVQNQRSTIEQITQLPQFQVLKDSNSAEDALFVQAMNQLQETVQSPAFEAGIRERIKESTSQTPLSGPQLLQQIKQQVPALETIEKWLWLVYSIGIASAFLLLGILLQGISLIWGFLFQRILPGTTKEKKPEQKKPAEPKEPPIIPPKKPVRSPNAASDQVSSVLRDELFPPKPF